MSDEKQISKRGGMKIMSSNHKRGQAAMEFLMTYGWAILVVLVIIGALAFFGVLSPDSLMPEKCSMPLQLGCKDFSVTDTATVDSVTVSFINNAGRSMVIKDFNVTSGEAITVVPAGCFSRTATGVTSTAEPATTLTLANGETKLITFDKQRDNLGLAVVSASCALTNTGRPKDKFKFNIRYSWQDSQLIDHFLEGELLAKVQR